MKTIFISLAALSVCMLYSCNEQEKKTEKETTVDSLTSEKTTDTSKLYTFDKKCVGVGNLTIPAGEADTMIKRFDSVYAKKYPAGKVTPEVWIDKLVLKSLLKHFEGGKYDGVRFINAVKNSGDPTSLIMVPTTKDTSAIYPKSKHKNSWDKINISSPDPYVYKDFNLDQKETERRSQLFENSYGKKPEDTTLCFSSSIWIDRCVFESLFEILDAPESEFDGIRVWQGAYSSMTNATMKPSQLRLRQSTLILVPTFSRGTLQHHDDWDIIQTKTKGGGGYNHGELCPKICP